MTAWLQLFKFLAILCLPYILWQFILLFGENGGMLVERFGFSASRDTFFASVWRSVTDYMGVFFVVVSEPILNLLGHETYSYDKVLGIIGERGVSIGRACLGFGSYIIFISLILAYPAKIKLKIIFGIIGMFSIFSLNITRIVVLVIGQKFFPDNLDFLHHHGFKFLVAAVVFIIWMIFFYIVNKDETSEELKTSTITE